MKEEIKIKTDEQPFITFLKDGPNHIMWKLSDSDDCSNRVFYCNAMTYSMNQALELYKIN